MARKKAVRPAAELDETIASLLAAALAKKLTAAQRIQPGTHCVRGTATIAVDCWVQKGEDGEQKKAWPARLILALALRELGEDLEGPLRRAAKKVLAADDWDKLDVADVDAAMAAVQKELADQVPLVPRSGNTSVTGQVRIMSFEQINPTPAAA